jgi:hypothetical protein
VPRVKAGDGPWYTQFELDTAAAGALLVVRAGAARGLRWQGLGERHHGRPTQRGCAQHHDHQLGCDPLQT